MQVNPQQWVDDGYIILREVIPPDRLESLRTSYETLVERQHQIWAGSWTGRNPSPRTTRPSSRVWYSTP